MFHFLSTYSSDTIPQFKTKTTIRQHILIYIIYDNDDRLFINYSIILSWE